MSIDNFNALKMVMDLETVAIDGAADYIEAPSAPSNYKDPVKIADYVADATRAALGKCSLDPDLCRIVALGWRLEEKDTEPHVFTCQNEDEERKALEVFWREIDLEHNRVRRLVSFNGFRFDLPVLMRRSLYLDIQAPYLNVDRYRSPHIDLWQKLSFNGAISAHGLAFYAKRFDLAADDDPYTGADIAKLVEEGQWDAVMAHCANDVNLTYELATRLHYIAFDEDAHDEAQREQVA